MTDDLAIRCPNCFMTDFTLLTISLDQPDFKQLGCCVCGASYNPGDTKEQAKVPEDVNMPEKLDKFLVTQREAAEKLEKLLQGYSRP